VTHLTAVQKARVKIAAESPEDNPADSAAGLARSYHPVSFRHASGAGNPNRLGNMFTMPVVPSRPEIMSGTPGFVGTRVPVQALLDYLEEGDTIDSFLDALVAELDRL
jgi:hypothetical protein